MIVRACRPALPLGGEERPPGERRATLPSAETPVTPPGTWSCCPMIVTSVHRLVVAETVEVGAVADDVVLAEAAEDRVVAAVALDVVVAVAWRRLDRRVHHERLVDRARRASRQAPMRVPAGPSAQEHRPRARRRSGRRRSRRARSRRRQHEAVDVAVALDDVVAELAADLVVAGAAGDVVVAPELGPVRLDGVAVVEQRDPVLADRRSGRSATAPVTSAWPSVPCRDARAVDRACRSARACAGRGGRRGSSTRRCRRR